MAYDDYILEEESREDLMYCYCHDNFWKKVDANENPYQALKEVFPDD